MRYAALLGLGLIFCACGGDDGDDLAGRPSFAGGAGGQGGVVAAPGGSAGTTDAPGGAAGEQGGSTSEQGGSATEPGGSGGTEGGNDAGGASDAGGSDDGGGGETAGGPVLRVHVSATTAPFTFDDDLSGQTPRAYASGLRSYRIYKDASDPNPATVFDYGDDFVLVPYQDGADTVVATVPIAGIPAGHYTRGRVVHTHVHYQVDATVHSLIGSAAGTFDNLQVMSDHVTIDGTEHDSGYYEYQFLVAGMTYPTSGTDAVPPQFSEGGFQVVFENGEWAFYFDLDVTIDPATTQSVDSEMRLNVDHCFRWQDQDGVGYATGVFDVTPSSIEPVKQFGANAFSVTFTPEP